MIDFRATPLTYLPHIATKIAGLRPEKNYKGSIPLISVKKHNQYRTQRVAQKSLKL